MKTLFWILKKLLKILIPVVVVAAGVYVAMWLIENRTTPVRTPAKPKPLSVRVVDATRSRERISVYENGTVLPEQSISLRAEVSGRIIEQSPELVPGGRFQAGDVILRIDPRDYQYVVEQRESDVENALFNLKEEEGKEVVAQREWKLLGDGIQTTTIGRELALRIPHRQKLQAALEAAKSRLQEAELMLERTTIRAPFNALVKMESVDLGQLVSTQAELATLIGTDQFWVQVSVPVESLQWIRVPNGAAGRAEEATSSGSRAKVIHDAGTVRIQCEGRVVRLLGDIEMGTRTARVLIAINDPFGLQPTISRGVRFSPPTTGVGNYTGNPVAGGNPNSVDGRSAIENEGNGGLRPTLPLLLGAYVRVEIEGPEVDGVFVLPRAAIREGNRIWIMTEDNTLAVRDTRILRSRPDDTVLVQDSLRDGERIIISRIGTPIPGMALQAESEGNISGVE